MGLIIWCMGSVHQPKDGFPRDILLMLETGCGKSNLHGKLDNFDGGVSNCCTKLVEW